MSQKNWLNICQNHNLLDVYNFHNNIDYTFNTPHATLPAATSTIFQPLVNTTITPLNGTYTEYETDIAKLTKDKINKRFSIIKNFLFYPIQTISAITQREFSNTNDAPFIQFENIIIYTKETFIPTFQIYVLPGFWHDIFLVDNTFNYGFDIISLHTYLLRYEEQQYSASVDEIFDFFSTRNFIQRFNSEYGKEFYIQEKNPISHKKPIFYDSFFSKFNNTDVSKICNMHDREIGYIFVIMTALNEFVEIYYTFWRHIKKQVFSIMPIPPQPPHEPLYYTNDYDPSINDVVLFNSSTELTFYKNNKQLYLLVCNIDPDFSIVEEVANFPLMEEDFLYNKYFIYGGINNLQQQNLSHFEKKNINIIINKDTKYINLKNINTLAKKYKFNNIFIIDLDRNIKKTLNTILDHPEIIGLEKSNIQNLLALPNEEVIGANRKRIMILDPIIESGTITWLFAQEKAGKTILALYLAQIIGTGNTPFGSWHSSDPKKVIYIDGEMPGDKIQSHINKILTGLDSDNSKKQKAFSVYPFAESEFEYEDILNENWQKEYLETLLQYDLIILDNYYTLYNSLNPINLIRWMKKITRKGPAFLVLDHTNSEGELQGSHVKRRAMDLGIHVELLAENEIDITFQHDRYGREHEIKPFKLTKFFSSSEFVLQPKFVFDNEKDIKLSAEDNELLAIYILKKNGELNKDVADKLNITASNLTKKLQKINFNHKLEVHEKDNKEKIKRQHEFLALYEKNKNELENNIEELIHVVSTSNL